MEILIVLAVIVFAMFAFVILFGAPYVPTLDKQVVEAFKLLDLKPGQTVTDLGSGDGKVLKYAASHGLKACGYELNPLLFVVSMFRCIGQRNKINISCKNFWGANLAETDAIYVFLLERYMPKLDKKITQEITKPVKVVSFAFAFPDREPVKRSGGLMLYEFTPEVKK